MKVGDTVPVTIGGHVVTNATVKELADGTVTLVVPGTLVVMATRTTIDDAPVQPSEPETETIITGVDRASGEGATASETSETPPSTESTSSTESTGSTDVSNAEVSESVPPVSSESEPTTEPAANNETPAVTDNTSASETAE